MSRYERSRNPQQGVSARRSTAESRSDRRLPHNRTRRPASRRGGLAALVGLFAACLVALTAVAPTALAAGVLVPENGAARGSLRMVDHLVDVKIVDRVAITTLTQTFENTTDQRLEGTYIFPIAEGADLTNFKLSFNGKMVEGEVLPADEAREVYESIVRRMKDPGLIEFIGRRLLKARIFPIEPKSTTTIEIQYQQVVDTTGGVLRYHYPLRTPGHDSRAYGKVAFNVDLRMKSSELKTAWSPSHDVEVVRDGEHRATVAFEKTGIDLNQDFMLLFDSDDSEVGFSLVTNREDDERYFLAVLSPKQVWDDAKEIPSDYVFVIDTSGSMAGEKIEQVREALKYCVSSLRGSDRFSIVRFSTGHDVVFDTLSEVNAQSREEATEAIARYTARGGTNIDGALTAALAIFDRSIDNDPADMKNRRKVIVFLTDGQGDRDWEQTRQVLTDKIDGDLKPHLRVFPFGVGTDVNTKLLDAIALGYGGAPTYVQPGQNLEYTLGDFFSIFSEPVLTNLKLTLPDVGAFEMYPPELGDLYNGRQIVLVGQFNENKQGRVVLTARRGDEDVRYVWENINFTDQDPAGFSVARLWAGRKIAYLIDRLRLVGDNEELKTELMELSTKYGIQTPYSSWLVTPEGRPMGAGDVLSFNMRMQDDERGRFRAMDSVGSPASAPPPKSFGRGSGGSDDAFEGGAMRESSQSMARGEAVAEAELLNDRNVAPVIHLVNASNAALARDGRPVGGGDDDSTNWWNADAAESESGLAAIQLGTTLNSMRGAIGDAGLGVLNETNQRSFAFRRINGRNYSNVGGVLMDVAYGERVNELVTLNAGRAEADLELINFTNLNFGSDAYFEVVIERPDLREALAAATYAVIMLDANNALLVGETGGLDELTDSQRALLRKTAPAAGAAKGG